MTSSGSRTSQRLAAGALVLVGTAVGLGLAEVAARVWAAGNGVDYRIARAALRQAERLPGAIFERNAEPVPRLRPGASATARTFDFEVVYDINSRGVRDREVADDAAPSATRIVALGDSFTFGEGVPYGERYTEVLEDELGVDVVNMGAPGYGIDASLVAFLIDGTAYRPDAVFLFVNAVDTTRDHTGLVRDGKLVGDPEELARTASRKGSTPRGDGTRYLSRSDSFFRYSPNAIIESSMLLSLMAYQWDLHELESRALEFWGSPTLAKRKLEPIHDRDARRIERTRILVRELARAAERAGAPLFVINIDADHPLEYLDEPDAPWVFVNLFPLLHEAGKERNLAFVYDRHYNPATHRLIGEELARRLAGVVGPGNPESFEKRREPAGG